MYQLNKYEFLMPSNLLQQKNTWNSHSTTLTFHFENRIDKYIIQKEFCFVYTKFNIKFVT